MGDAATIWTITIVVTLIPVAVIALYLGIGRSSSRRVRRAVDEDLDAVTLVGGIDAKGCHVPVPFARIRISATEVEIARRRGRSFDPVVIAPEEARRITLSRSLLILLTYVGPRGRVRFTTVSRRALCTAVVHYEWDVAGLQRACGRFARTGPRRW